MTAIGDLNKLTLVDIDVTLGFSNATNWKALGGKPELKTLHVRRQHPSFPFTSSTRLAERLDWLMFKDPGGYRWRRTEPIANRWRSVEKKEFHVQKAHGAFCPSPKLEVLAFDNVDPGLVDLQCCAEMPSLRVLEINGSPTLESLAGIENCPQIEWLFITHCPNLNDVSSLRSLSNLKLLAITDATIAKPMPALASDGLLRIDLSGTHGFENLQFLAGATRLERINLEQSGVHSLQGLGSLSALTELRVSGSELKTIGCGRVTAPLKVLDFSGCEQLVDIQELEQFDELQNVKLSRCPSLRTLKGVKACDTQVFLDLVDCRALKNLSGLNGWKSLQHVNVTGCQSLESLDALLDAENLSSLHWKDCPKLTDKELAKLRRKFEFFHDTNKLSPNSK